MSLVADYSDSSSDSDEESSTNESEKGEVNKTESPPAAPTPKLPSASAALDKAAAKKAGDVFSNPFLEAELHKKASLERHVKMVNNDDHLQLKNGRKICWNYRKGRCRFGTGCQYAHDSDLSVEQAAAAQEAKMQVTPTSFTAGSNGQSRRKRPGLGDAIEPGKKVLKSYQSQGATAGRRPPSYP